jgi:hypothetical protein
LCSSSGALTELLFSLSRHEMKKTLDEKLSEGNKVKNLFMHLRNNVKRCVKQTNSMHLYIS